MDLEIIDPTEFAGWDDLLLTIPERTVFHTSFWAKVLKASYGYRPIYFTRFENCKISFLLPIMEINSLITGKRGVSLPFTDYCRVIFQEDGTLSDRIGSAIEYSKKARWNYLEIRDGRHLIPREPIYSSYQGHMLDLTKGEEKVYSDFRDSTKRNIKKAEKEGVRIRIEKSKWAVDQFYKLHCPARREHGLPPQPKFFFDRVYEYMISRDLGFVVLGLLGDRVIASAMFFQFGGNGIYKYGAADKKYQHLRATNGVIWEGIKWFCCKGHKTLSFGRTEPHNIGLLQFKNGWGVEERKICYQKYDIPASRFIGEERRRNSVLGKIFSKVPLPALKLTGSLVYKHFG